MPKNGRFCAVKRAAQAALTVTVSVSTGATLNRSCSSAAEANVLPWTCLAGNWKLSDRSANGYGSSRNCREPADRTYTRLCPPLRKGNGCNKFAGRVKSTQVSSERLSVACSNRK